MSAEKSLEQKIKNCKELVIQNVQKAMQHKMVFLFLRERKMDGDVTQMFVNNKDGIVKIEFTDHEKAFNFYRSFNFCEKILIRPFNIYFNLSLNDDQKRKYYLEGITEANQRALFEAAIKIGICKLYTKYETGSRGPLKSGGTLSFLKKEDLSNEEFTWLSDSLKQIGIKISTYIASKANKISINLIDFIPQDNYEKDEATLKELGENQAKSIFEKYAGKYHYSNISVIVRKKYYETKFNQQRPPKLVSSALYELNYPQQEIVNCYDQFRVGVLNESEMKVRLALQNQSKNGYHCLISQGLIKKQDQSDKNFEEDLLKSFRSINPNVLQVSVSQAYPTKLYFAKINLANELEGKNFIVDYLNHKSKLYHYFVDKLVNFNLKLDDKTLKEMKAAEHKTKSNEIHLKRTSEKAREVRRASNQVPLINNVMIGGSMLNPMVQHPKMYPPAPTSGGIMGPGQMLPMGQIGQMIPMGAKGHFVENKGNFPPPPFYGRVPEISQNVAPTFAGNPSSAQTFKIKLSSLLRDQERFLQMQQNQAKKIMSEMVKSLIEEEGIANGHEATRISNFIMKDRSVLTLISMLENSQLMKEAAINVKSRIQ